MKLALLLTTALLLVGCATTTTHTMNHGMPMDHTMHMVHSEEDFLVNMIPHHQEAVDTSLIIAAQTNNPALKDLADNIVTAQRQEIAMMQEWLTDSSVEPTYQNMMPDLDALEGDSRDIAYLQGMIMHHTMAVMMAEQVLSLEPSLPVYSFAKQVIAVQTDEIAQMEVLLLAYE